MRGEGWGFTWSLDLIYIIYSSMVPYESACNVGRENDGREDTRSDTAGHERNTDCLNKHNERPD